MLYRVTDYIEMSCCIRDYYADKTYTCKSMASYRVHTNQTYLTDLHESEIMDRLSEANEEWQSQWYSETCL